LIDRLGPLLKQSVVVENKLLMGVSAAHAIAYDIAG
jgi:hypothetical protein